MSIEANKDVVRAFYVQAATGDRNADLVAANLRYHGPDMLDDLQGREAFVQLLSTFHSAFPDFETNVHHLAAEGEPSPSGTRTAASTPGSSPAFQPRASTSS